MNIPNSKWYFLLRYAFRRQNATDLLAREVFYKYALVKPKKGHYINGAADRQKVSENSGKDQCILE